MLPRELFLSHSNLDDQFTAALAETMRRHGIPTWYSETNIVGAQQWHDEIGAALRRCDWFMLVLSPNSVASKWVKRELLFVLKEDRFENRIVPVLHQPCDADQLSWTLSSFQMIDFNHSPEEGYRNLMCVWGLGYKPDISS